MKKVHHYSEVKFRQFDVAKQQRILREILQALLDNCGEPERFELLLYSYTECMGFCEGESFTAYRQIGKALKKGLSEDQVMRLCMENDVLLGDGYRLDLPRIRKYDGKTGSDRFPFQVILDNLRSAFNVGSIFRTAECLGWEKIWLCGNTPTPENPKVTQAAMGTVDAVPWDYRPDIREIVAQLKAQGYQIVGLETAEGSVLLQDAEIRLPAVVILGNEALGLAEELLDDCDLVVEIPVWGSKNSLNVGVAFAICGYELNQKAVGKKGE